MMLRFDKTIHEFYEVMQQMQQDFNWYKPFGKDGRYATYYAEERLYLVFDTQEKGLYLTKADSPKEAVRRVVEKDLVYAYTDKSGVEFADNPTMIPGA